MRILSKILLGLAGLCFLTATEDLDLSPLDNTTEKLGIYEEAISIIDKLEARIKELEGQ